MKMFVRQPIVALYLCLSIVGLSACGSQNPSPSPSVDSSPPLVESPSPESFPTPKITESPLEKSSPLETSKSPVTKTPVKQETLTTPKVTQTKIKVFFPKNPETAKNLTDVDSVWRTTAREGIAKFAIQQVINGPTEKEKQQGLTQAIALQGNSTCGEDFTLSIQQGVARLQFCKTVVSAGIGDDARTRSSLEATLKQFSTVKSIIILDKNGNCLADQSGENLCLN